jgi:hypothetical protein
MASFDTLLRYSDNVFGVLSRADAAILYVSPNVSRIFHFEPAVLLGCARKQRRKRKRTRFRQKPLCSLRARLRRLLARCRVAASRAREELGAHAHCSHASSQAARAGLLYR